MLRYMNWQIEPYTTGQRLALCMSHALTATSTFPPGRHFNEPPRNSHATATSSSARVLQNQFCSICKHGNLMHKKIAGGRRMSGRLQRQEEKILEKPSGKEEARKICAQVQVYIYNQTTKYIYNITTCKKRGFSLLSTPEVRKTFAIGKVHGLILTLSIQFMQYRKNLK